MGLGDRFHQFRRRGDVTHLPARQAEALAGGADAHRPIAHAGQRHQRDVAPVVEDDVLVHLVADRIDVVLQAEPGDEGQFLLVEDLRAGIHRRVEQDQLGLRPEGGGQFLPGQPPVWRLQPHQLRHAPCPSHHRQVGIVERLDQHDLVARLDQAEQAVAERLGRARRDQDLGLPVDVEPLEPLRMIRNGLAQFGNAHHGRVLVVPGQQVLRRRRPHLLGSLVVGEALAEVDGLVLARERRHDFKYRGPECGHGRVCGFHWGFSAAFQLTNFLPINWAFRLLNRQTVAGFPASACGKSWHGLCFLVWHTGYPDREGPVPACGVSLAT